jgi:CRP/FNR family transcriptional regulator, dissimilatory nitrate respiration regulator
MLNIAEKDIASRQPGPFLACLRGASLFSNLSDEELECFNDAAYLETYEKGDILYLKDEPAEFFYVIYRGWIKLFHAMPKGKEVIVDMLTAGQMVGESAIFENCRHTSSAQVVEHVQLLRAPSKLLKEQMCLKPKLACSMLSSMSRHHRRHYGRIAINAMQNAPQRIGCFLLRLCHGNEKKHIIFHLPYDKTLIAETLGMEGATFSRALNTLRQKTAICINGSRVEIDSLEQLVKFVYGSLATEYLVGKQLSGMMTAGNDDFSESYNSAYWVM